MINDYVVANPSEASGEAIRRSRASSAFAWRLTPLSANNLQ